MQLITIEQARAQTHADGVDDAMLTVYANAAEQAAQDFLNRRVYADESTMSAAHAGVSAMLEAADAAYEAAIEAAGDLEGSARCAAMDAACNALAAARSEAREVNFGMVVNDAIRSGVLLILGHLYRNREDVVIGQTAVALPMGAQSLLWPHRIGLSI